jgi:putative tricarboxylic transport membrane protein
MLSYCRGLGIALLLCAAPLTAIAQTAWKPSRVIELIVPSSPGGGNDITARTLQLVLRDRKQMGESLIINNRPGGGHQIALTALVQKKGDPHLLMAATTTIMTSYLSGQSQMSHRDGTVVSVMLGEPIVVSVRTDSKFKTLRDLMAQAKASPGTVSFAVSGAAGNSNHMGVVLPVQATGLDQKAVRTVFFKGGGEVMTAMLGGHVDAISTGAIVAARPKAAGQLRVIAVLTPKRLTGDFADVPTAREQGVDAVFDQVRYLLAPKGIPAAALPYYDRVLRDAYRTPEWRRYIDDNALQLFDMTAVESAKHVEQMYEAIRRVYKEIGMLKQ